MNFVKPTPVQAQAIPPALTGKDIIASAQTGTGKTAAFGIPLLTYLSTNPDKTALILTPTRELAMQVMGVLHKLSGSHPGLASVLLIGGANMDTQMKNLARKPRLMIGTPGRVIDHLNRRSLNLAATGFLVLDEADRMLDMGFAPQLDQIRARLTSPRQTLLFSATIPSDIQAMAAKYLKEPVRISVGPAAQPVPKIAQKVLHTSEARKPEELLNELKERQGSVLIFARTQHRVDRINQRLKEAGLKVTRIHGGRTQGQRKQAIDQFREGLARVLVATDIAARGLDIHHIAHVINYDLPRNPEDYIHRVGRTARAGAEGSSLCFLTPEDKALWNRILRLMGPTQGAIQTKPSLFGDHTPQSPPAQPGPHRGHPPQHRQGHRPQGQPPRKEHHHRSQGEGSHRGPSHPVHEQRHRDINRQGQEQKGGHREDERGGQDRHRQFHRDRFDRGQNRNDRFIFHGQNDEHHQNQRRSQQGEVDGNRTDFNRHPSGEKKPGFFQNLKRKFSGNDGQNRNFSRPDHRSFKPEDRRRGHEGRFEGKRNDQRGFGDRPQHPGHPQRHEGHQRPRKKNFRPGQHHS